MLKDTACGICAFCKAEIMAGPKTDAQFHFTGVKKYFIALMVLSFKSIFKKPPVCICIADSLCYKAETNTPL